MLSSSFVRGSGLVNVVAGILAIVGAVIHPATEDPVGVLNIAWVPAHVLLWVAFTLALLGWIGLHARQSEKAGSLGVVGFALLFIGNVAVTGILFDAATVEPFIASSAPNLLEAIGGSLLPVFLVIIVVFGIGGILFGAAVIRARVLSRAGGLLLLAGSLFMLVTVAMPEKVFDAAVVVFALGQVWLGRSVWSAGR